MGYKVGDEVLVKAVINDICVGKVHPYEVKAADNPRCGSSARVIYVREEDVLPAPTMTAEEAWDIAKKILLYPAHGGFNATELEEIFGRTEHLWELTPQQAKAKIEAWEAEKEIKVGDEVRLKRDPGDEYKFFITNKDGFEISGFSGFKGSVFSCRDIRLYEKTGRHIDIDGILKQIGGDE